MNFWGWVLKGVGMAVVRWLLRGQPVWLRRVRLGWALGVGARQLALTFA